MQNLAIVTDSTADIPDELIAQHRIHVVPNYVEMLRNLGKLERLAILHTNAEEDAHRIFDSQDLTPSTNPFCVNVTPVIGAHSGPNALGFAAVVQ